MYTYLFVCVLCIFIGFVHTWHGGFVVGNKCKRALDLAVNTLVNNIRNERPDQARPSEPHTTPSAHLLKVISGKNQYFFGACAHSAHVAHKHQLLYTIILRKPIPAARAQRDEQSRAHFRAHAFCMFFARTKNYCTYVDIHSVAV